MSNEWDEHRDRFSERAETFDAYVDVWNRDADAQRNFADWITFARCADADMSMVQRAGELVRQAEQLLTRNGYRMVGGAGGASRRWSHTRGEVRTNSSTAGRYAVERRAGRHPSSATPKTPRVKKPAAPPKPPARPTHVECPNDPGMMVPLTGSCFCGWSPSDAD